MVTPVLGRSVESDLIGEFLAAAAAEPAATLIEGEAGIGKTTLWLAAIDSAAEAGFLVLAARPAQAESVLAYSALSDMLEAVDDDAWTDIPEAQRLALDRMLLRGGADEVASDPRAVAAGFVSLVKNLEQTRPVLVAVDDLQWLDSSSLQVIAFAARRLSGRTGVLGTVRTDSTTEVSTAWLQLPSRGTVRRIQLGPLTLGSLRAAISDQLGRSLSRAAMVRIYEVSQGNPFYALELTRAMDEGPPQIKTQLPRSLAELVRARIGTLDAEVRTVLLAASCVSAPTVDLVERATGQDAERVVGLLAEAENKGIVSIDGHRICFTHPLLARGIYSEATAAQRREVHRKFADILDEPELKARHLAMAVAWGDPHTLDCLDTAAETAAMRGAPAAAAELLDMAIELGGDTPQRRIRSARDHFNAGDAVRARALLQTNVPTSGPIAAEALTLLGVVEFLEGSRAVAARLLQRALDECGDNLALRVHILVPLALALFSDHQIEAARSKADEAVAAATRLGEAHLLSEALSTQVSLGCWSGRGIDHAALQRALELEDPDARTPIFTRPSMHNAVLLAFTGRLEEAREVMRSISADCDFRGDESEQIIVAVHRVLVEIWRADFTEASVIAEDALERARLLDGDLPRAGALTVRAAVAAYVGRPEDARRDAEEAQPAVQASGAVFMTALHVIAAGFLEVSLGNHAAALSALDPLLSTFDPESTEIYFAAFIPDAVEALVALGRLDEAEPLVEALERNGRRLDRPWMLAVGARCRSMLQGARGDTAAAVVTAREAMTHHARIPMPFERARTQLILGQLERRQRHREAATTALRAALTEFERLNTPLWADRARAELARTDVVTNRATSELTVGEQRVAELAAEGMTNRDVAAKLFVSPKTVEANLVRIYRKLGIHSRAELGRLFNGSHL